MSGCGWWLLVGWRLVGSEVGSVCMVVCCEVCCEVGGEVCCEIGGLYGCAVVWLVVVGRMEAGSEVGSAVVCE